MQYAQLFDMIRISGEVQIFAGRMEIHFYGYFNAGNTIIRRHFIKFKIQVSTASQIYIYMLLTNWMERIFGLEKKN